VLKEKTHDDEYEVKDEFLLLKKLLCWHPVFCTKNNEFKKKKLSLNRQNILLTTKTWQREHLSSRSKVK